MFDYIYYMILTGNLLDYTPEHGSISETDIKT